MLASFRIIITKTSHSPFFDHKGSFIDKTWPPGFTTIPCRLRDFLFFSQEVTGMKFRLCGTVWPLVVPHSYISASQFFGHLRPTSNLFPCTWKEMKQTPGCDALNSRFLRRDPGETTNTASGLRERLENSSFPISGTWNRRNYAASLIHPPEATRKRVIWTICLQFR